MKETYFSEEVKKSDFNIGDLIKLNSEIFLVAEYQNTVCIHSPEINRIGIIIHRRDIYDAKLFHGTVALKN